MTLLQPSAARLPREARWRDRVGLVVLFAVAFLIRLLPVLSGGGLHYYGRYDDGVYYTAAEALSFGHLPYRAFVLLHPPGGALALLPFTLVGRVTSDPTGMMLARLAVMALGALSAVLVALLAARWGRQQALIAGLIYACSAATVYSEQATFLEPLGGVLMLLALLALTRPRDAEAAQGSIGAQLWAGLALGLACSVKIWYVAPFAAVVLVLALQRSWRSVLRVVGSGAVSAAVVLVPFFAYAPRQMWTMVVSDQLDRLDSPKGRWERVLSIVGTKPLHEGHPAAADAIAAVVVVVSILAVVLCLADRRARMVAAVAVANLATLLASPSYFNHYGTFVVGPLAVVLAVALGAGAGGLARPAPRALLAGGVAVLLVASGVAVALRPTGERFPGSQFAAAAPPGCITADDPAALIQMNRLTADFRAHCPVAVDITGASYGASVRRSHNAAFHRWLMGYLTNSDAFVLLRPKHDAFSPAQKRAIRQYATIVTARGLYLRAGLNATGGPSGPPAAGAAR